MTSTQSQPRGLSPFVSEMYVLRSRCQRELTLLARSHLLTRSALRRLACLLRCSFLSFTRCIAMWVFPPTAPPTTSTLPFLIWTHAQIEETGFYKWHKNISELLHINMDWYFIHAQNWTTVDVQILDRKNLIPKVFMLLNNFVAGRQVAKIEQENFLAYFVCNSWTPSITISNTASRRGCFRAPSAKSSDVKISSKHIMVKISNNQMLWVYYFIRYQVPLVPALPWLPPSSHQHCLGHTQRASRSSVILANLLPVHVYVSVDNNPLS